MATNEEGIVIRCPRCGQGNRVPFARLGSRARCGACHEVLHEPGRPLPVDGATLEALILGAPRPLLVDFWAPWCGPCRMVAPQLEQVARRMADELLVVKVNTDESPDAGARHGVRSIPLLALFARGREIWREAGARPAAQIEQLVRNALAHAA